MIKRINPYLKGRPRMAIKYEFQEPSENLLVFTDSDWAGDEETRRSTKIQSLNVSSGTGSNSRQTRSMSRAATRSNFNIRPERMRCSSLALPQ